MATAQDTAVRRIAALRVLPVVELPDADVAAPLAAALVGAGLDAMEITLRTDAGLQGISVCRAEFPDALVGAGTVRTAKDARRAIDAGAQFIVSPGTDLDVIALCRAEGVPVLPGACTPTEVDTAMRAGADAVKFFPAEPKRLAAGGTSRVQR